MRPTRLTLIDDDKKIYPYDIFIRMDDFNMRRVSGDADFRDNIDCVVHSIESSDDGVAVCINNSTKMCIEDGKNSLGGIHTTGSGLRLITTNTDIEGCKHTKIKFHVKIQQK